MCEALKGFQRGKELEGIYVKMEFSCCPGAPCFNVEAYRPPPGAGGVGGKMNVWADGEQGFAL